MQNDLLAMLESLLSITESEKGNLNNDDLREWQRISAAVADIRLSSIKVPDDDYALNLLYKHDITSTGKKS